MCKSANINAKECTKYQARGVSISGVECISVFLGAVVLKAKKEMIK